MKNLMLKFESHTAKGRSRIDEKTEEVWTRHYSENVLHRTDGPAYYGHRTTDLGNGCLNSILFEKYFLFGVEILWQQYVDWQCHMCNNIFCPSKRPCKFLKYKDKDGKERLQRFLF